jgi:hypothetical protein
MRPTVTPLTPVEAQAPTRAEATEATEAAVTGAMTVTTVGTRDAGTGYRHEAATVELLHRAAAAEVAAAHLTVEAAEAAAHRTVEAADADEDVLPRTVTRPTRYPTANRTRHPNLNNQRFGIRSRDTRYTTFNGYR